jgi:two-component system phosphate regulon sensor histidine kinase PhoR
MKTPMNPALSLMQNDMMQSVVHDLRTPMTVIKGYIQLLISGGLGEMNSDQMQLLRRSVGPLEDLILLTDNLLQSISLQKGHVELNCAPMELDRVLAETIEFYTLPFQQRRMRIFRDGNTVNVRVLVDSFWLKRVLHNLVWNAYKFTPDGGQVVLTVTHHEGGLQINVADTGRGIPKEKLKKIFEKFEQTTPDRDSKMGSGLGLWICNRVLELHGGHITVLSTEGQGSKFSLWLPPSRIL